jgi:hypothetical protein
MFIVKNYIDYRYLRKTWLKFSHPDPHSSKNLDLDPHIINTEPKHKTYLNFKFFLFITGTGYYNLLHKMCHTVE